MSARTAGIPRYRPFVGPALLRQGFRPFFLGAGGWALAAMALWIAILQGSFSLPTAFDPVAWHVHEMLFGFVVAAIAGFLLTAIPNWTGRMPLQGAPLRSWSGSGSPAVSRSAYRRGSAPASRLSSTSRSWRCSSAWCCGRSSCPLSLCSTSSKLRRYER
jgi:NnrS protein